jgi:hypothetical protein
MADCGMSWQDATELELDDGVPPCDVTANRLRDQSRYIAFGAVVVELTDYGAHVVIDVDFASAGDRALDAALALRIAEHDLRAERELCAWPRRRGRPPGVRNRQWRTTCDHCGATFMSGRDDACYCSSRCRVAAYRRRKVAPMTDEESSTAEQPPTPELLDLMEHERALAAHLRRRARG